jgi:hypothetical protein
MPKQFALGLIARHLTGSSRVLYILNSFGHAASHSSVLELDTVLASMHHLSDENVPRILCGQIIIHDDEQEWTDDRSLMCLHPAFNN